MKSNETVLIAGAAGFIGSHLVDTLLNRGLKVVGVDNLVTGSEVNLQTALSHPDFSFLKHDISTPLNYPGKLDYIFDLACPASPVDFGRLRMAILKATGLGTYQLLELAKTKRARFLLSSTSEVYGDPLVSPQNEDYWGNVNPIGIRSIYDEGKRFGEAMTMTYHREYHLETRIVRIFNTYGERMRRDDGRAVPTFINQALHDEPLTVFGAGTQTRSPQYVSDLINGLIKLMDSSVILPVNMGNPEELSMLDLAKLIIKLTGSSSTVSLSQPLPEDDPKRRRPDISRAKSLLGWEPHVSLEDGLQKTIDWFKQN